jgi:hypothetical protein
VATGCDYSREASGIPGIGYNTACRLLETLERVPSAAFTGCIREHIGWIPSMSKEFKEEVLTVGQDEKDRLLDEYIFPVVNANYNSLFFDATKPIRLMGFEKKRKKGEKTNNNA